MASAKQYLSPQFQRTLQRAIAVGTIATAALMCGCSTIHAVKHEAVVKTKIHVPSTVGEYMKKTPDEERYRLVISVPEQRMALLDGETVIREYSISTALKGVSEALNSDGTPRGLHVIAEKIGDGQPVGMIFKGREPIGVISELNPTEGIPPVVTRLFRLRGLESSNQATYDRLIYLHGSPHEALLGQPASGGCIRMKSEDVIALFNTIEVGTPITILESSLPEAIVATLEQQRTYTALRQRALLDASILGSDASTMHRLCAGHMYGLDGIAQNYPAAKVWCELASAKSESSSMTLLAELYEQGSLGEADLPKARKLYETAAALGHTHALKKAASMQQQGTGGPRDAAAAVQNIARLAASGSIDSPRTVNSESTTKPPVP
jgi:L,D-transpeptidase catalytic domain/Sel1 repeat